MRRRALRVRLSPTNLPVQGGKTFDMSNIVQAFIQKSTL